MEGCSLYRVVLTGPYAASGTCMYWCAYQCTGTSPWGLVQGAMLLAHTAIVVRTHGGGCAFEDTVFCVLS